MAAVVAFSVACGTSPPIGSAHNTDDFQADAGLDDGSTDGSDAARPAGICVTDDDCLAVLDYRAGFTCWSPEPASKADVAADPCLIPWNPDPRCSTPAPPAECPSGPLPVNHSCFTIPCTSSSCNEGKCTVNLRFGAECPTIDAGAPDCDALLTTYRAALATARECDPAKDTANCTGDYADGCGCEAPYKASGPHANAVMCAFDAWRNASCVVPSCGNTCVTPTKAGATCVANASGTMGTCVWKQ